MLTMFPISIKIDLAPKPLSILIRRQLGLN